MTAPDATARNAFPKAVWKFPIPVADRFSIRMPIEAKPLCVMAQREEMQLWALVDPALPPTTRHFRLAGTGHEIAESIKAYIGSVQLAGGDLILHLFEIEP